MRRSLSSLLYGCLAACFCVFAAAEEPVLATVESYTDALQAGDIATLKDILGGRMYLRQRALLEDNTEYSQWLRDYYAGAQFSSSVSERRSEQYPDGTVVEVVLVFSSGASAQIDLVAVSGDSRSGWKIIDELR
jgi:hypothetical protein